MSEWFVLKPVLDSSNTFAIKPQNGDLSCGACVMQVMALLYSFLFIVVKLVRSAAKKD